MKRFTWFFIFGMLTAPMSFGQDSPLQADPGTPPPPQGWSQATPENSGIHIPTKKKKTKLAIKRSAGNSDLNTPNLNAAPPPAENPTVMKQKSTPKATPADGLPANP